MHFSLAPQPQGRVEAAQPLRNGKGKMETALALYLCENLNDIYKTYGDKRLNTIRLTEQECISVFEKWCSEAPMKLDASSWRYGIKIIRNMLTSGNNKEVIRLILRHIVKEGTNNER